MHRPAPTEPGASRVVSLDLYRKEIQGFFSIPVDNLRASPFLIEYVRNNVSQIFVV